MKKLLALLLAVGVTASIVEAQQVLSQNAVGYVKVELEEGNLYLLRNDFESVDGSPMSIENVLGEQVPASTIVTFYDELAQSYRPGIVRTVFGWGPQGTNVLERGKGFFLRLPETTPDPTYDLFIMGEVPDDDAPSTHVAGLNMSGFPFPAAISWTDTELADQLPASSIITTWDAVNQTYEPGIVKTVFGWGPTGDALELSPGQGFFVRIPSGEPPVVFDEVKPYTWP